tara:strand:+ start:3926 stop:6265 length:2340 start_codon:yes stop_codon:yes gene_type:complete
MAELPKGVTKEVRRGGSGVLELLLIDFDREGSDGYFRIEKDTSPTTIAQLVIVEGNPAMALFEHESLLMGHSALEELRKCAADDDSRISVHTDVDLGLISDLHPEAKLHIREEDDISGQKIEGWIIDTKSDSHWWRHKQKRDWAMTEATLTEEDDNPAEQNIPEIIEYTPGEELESGSSYLVDDQTPDSVMEIAAHLGSIGHPLLVISRSPPHHLAEQFGFPPTCCRWLSERELEGVKSLHPGLESVRRECDEFLWGSTRSVIVIDGVEYLSVIHGFSRLLGMLRDLLDVVSTSDDIVLIPADLDVWDGRERALLLRECDQIPIELAREWAERPAVVEGHSFSQDSEGATIPEPKTINVVSEAAGDFKEAAARLLSSAEQADSSKSEDESKPIEFQQPNTSFSARSLIDEIRLEEATESPLPELDVEVDEEIITTTDSNNNDDLQLPDWATAPSANMGDVTNTSNASIDEPVEKSEELEVAEELVVESSTSEDEIEDVVEVKNLPMQPTVNYRGRSKRRLTVPRKPDILQLEKGSMRYAATNSKPFEGELADSGFEAIDSSVTALNSKKDDFRDVGDWITTEERDWKVLETAGMGAAVENSRAVRHKVKTVESSSISRLHVRQWGAAADSAAQANARATTPEMVGNPNVRESASRAQHVKTLTQLLVGSELDALYSDREQMVSSSGIKLEILERISALGEKGHPIRHLVERIEANSKEGMIMLDDLEKKSELIDDLIKRLNIQEDRSVIEPKVASRYRNQLIQFKLIGEVESMLKDFEG